jgi:chemotaxis protein CheY-P-specific phosphatase CheC
MVAKRTHNLERTISTAFEAGFSNAARAFAQMTKKQVVVSSFHTESCQLHNSLFAHNNYKSYNEGVRILLTTELFGDVTGKSYLFLSPKDYTLLTASIPASSSVNLKEEFLKELDNILSAAVITNLSNQLNSKIFGDIPIMVGETKSQLEDIIGDDYAELSGQIWLTTASFSFEDQPDICPLFLWVLDRNSLEGITQTV